jgi:ribosomal protein S20
MAISNPYGFSLDNPFSQQPSFIGDAAGNIVGSKKKSRVEFQDGSFVRLPKEKPPVPEKKFPVPKEKPPVPEEGFLPREAPAVEKLMNDPLLAEEIAGGSIDDLQRILEAGEHTYEGNTVLKNNKFVVYKDSKGFPTIGGINLNDYPEIAKKVEEAGNSLSFEEYAKYHNEMLSEADKWVENLVKKTGNSNYSTAAPVLRDMYFNMGQPTLKTFKNMLDAIGKGDIDTAVANIVYTNPDSKNPAVSPYYSGHKNRADRNISKLLKAFEIPTAT